MKKLPNNQGKLRAARRNVEKNEARIMDMIEERIATGNIKNLTEARKKQMREYIRTKRGLPITEPINVFLNLSEEEIKEAKRIAKNTKQREVRKAFRLYNPLPKRVRADPKPKPKKIPKRKMASVKLNNMGKVPKPTLELKIKNNSTLDKIPVRINSKTTIYVSAGQDIEKIREKYLNRI